MSDAPPYLEFGDFADWGVRALITTRAAGSFSTASAEPVGDVMRRWEALLDHVVPGPERRFATSRQVHAATVVVHTGEWTGWLRGGDADGHLALRRGTAAGVSVADCVPIYVAHPSGAVAILHSGWRGTVAGILERALAVLTSSNLSAADSRIVLGPAICGACYEVSPDVYAELTGRRVDRPTPVDLRGLLADRARALGVRDIRTSPACTRCDNTTFFSHRAGDPGRQIGVIVAPDA